MNIKMHFIVFTSILFQTINLFALNFVNENDNKVISFQLSSALENNKPVDNIASASIQAENIYIVTNFNISSSRKYKYDCIIEDSENNYVFCSSKIITGNSVYTQVVTTVKISQLSLKPGTYMITILLNNEFQIDKEIILDSSAIDIIREEKKFLIGLGINSINELKNNNRGGSFMYSGIGYKLNRHLSLNFKYLVKYAPTNIQEQQIDIGINFYSNERRKNTCFYSSIFYNKELFENDIGGIGLEFALYSTDLDRNVVLTFLPVAIIYNIYNPKLSIRAEILRAMVYF